MTWNTEVGEFWAIINDDKEMNTIAEIYFMIWKGSLIYRNLDDISIGIGNSVIENIFKWR